MSDSFIAHLEEASRIVSGWPEWKRNVLGTQPMPTDPTKIQLVAGPPKVTEEPRDMIVQDSDGRMDLVRCIGYMSATAHAELEILPPVPPPQPKPEGPCWFRARHIEDDIELCGIFHPLEHIQYRSNEGWMYAHELTHIRYGKATLPKECDA